MPGKPTDPTAPAATQKPKRPAPSGAWKKGQSGNPAGTSKTPPEVRAFLRDLSMEAAQALAGIIRRAATPEKLAELQAKADEGGSAIEALALAADKDVIAASKTVLDFSVAKPKDEGPADGAATAVITALAQALTAPRKVD